MTKNYFNNSQGFVLAYDINNRETFEKVEYWIEEIKAKADENIKCILIGTKCDLDKREVNEEEGIELGEKYGFKFLETSAKENININEAFDTLVSEIIKKYEGVGRNSLTLSKTNLKKKKKKCC